MRREGLTLKAIGERLGVTRERVRQIEAFGERRARLARVVSGKAD
jgi:DNA-directed RNA polymerase sigma subunit (sigma70/sigma32)